MTLDRLPLKPPPDDLAGSDRQRLISTIQPATPDQTPGALVRTIEGLVVFLMLASFAISAVLWASQRSDDIKATRRAVESVQPCR